MPTLATVQNYVSSARTLLQDSVEPYRYPDADLVEGLNFAILEARKMRPDLFLGQTTLESFSTSDSTAVTIDEQYRVAFVYYMVGHAQLRDDEGEQDARASAFLAKFTQKLAALG
jgi:hypothetical protein